MLVHLGIYIMQCELDNSSLLLGQFGLIHQDKAIVALIMMLDQPPHLAEVHLLPDIKVICHL